MLQKRKPMLQKIWSTSQ